MAASTADLKALSARKARVAVDSGQSRDAPAASPAGKKMPRQIVPGQ
jgi:hypothetical protein